MEPLLRELHTLIASDNVNTVNVVEQLKPLLNDRECDGHLNKLISAVEDYEFDMAMGTLKNLASRLEITL